MNQYIKKLKLILLDEFKSFLPRFFFLKGKFENRRLSFNNLAESEIKRDKFLIYSRSARLRVGE